MKVLIADDHELVREGICRKIIDIDGISEVAEAYDADSVLQKVKEDEAISLLILDLYMPGANGFELLSTITNHFPEITVVVLSASEDRAKMRKAIDLGASGFIPKSAPYAVMLNAIRLVISGAVYIPENLYAEETKNSNGFDQELDNNRSLEQLTKRQNEVLMLVGDGKSNKEIARILNLSENTVKIHLSSIFKTLDINNRTQAGIIARQLST